MSYIKYVNKSMLEPLLKNNTVLKFAVHRNIYHPPELISRTYHKELIPYQVVDPGDYTPFTVGSITMTISNYNVKIEGAGTWEQYNPDINGMYVLFVTGNQQWFMGPGTYIPGGVGYVFTVESNSSFTATYTQNQWNLFVEEAWTNGEYVFEEDIVYEKAQNYRWGSRVRDGLTLSPYDIQDTEYVRNSYSEIIDRWPASRVYLGKQAFVYLGYGPRNEWGLSGTTVQNIYDIYTCQIGNPPAATYSWVYRGEIEFIGGVIPYDWYDTDTGTPGKQFSVTFLNNLYPPNQSLEGKFIGDFLRQEYKEASPGNYQNHSYYDVYECLQIN